MWFALYSLQYDLHLWMLCFGYFNKFIYGAREYLLACYYIPLFYFYPNELETWRGDKRFKIYFTGFIFESRSAYLIKN